MLKIKTGGFPGAEHTWTHGNPIPMNSAGMSRYPLTNVSEIVADGKELAYIKDKFDGIPLVEHDTIKWVAPFAQFIYDNLV